MLKMKPSSAKKEYLGRLKKSGRDLATLQPAIGFEVMLDFYAKERADGCSIEEDGDMLLYQWGTHDWGDGESFQYNVTRQFIVADGDDDEIQQLSLTFHFAPSKSLGQLESGSKWCRSPDELGEFRTYITESAPIAVIAQLKPVEVTLELFAV